MEKIDYDPKKSTEKGLDAGVSATVGGAVVTLVQLGITLSQGGTLTEAAATGLVSALITLGAAGAAAVRAWWRNRKKHKIPVGPADINYRGLGGYVLAMVGLAVGLAGGCQTVKSTDGTITTSIDPVAIETALTTYERLIDRQALLKEERAKALAAQDAERVALVEAELEKLQPRLNELAAKLGFVDSLGQ